MVLINLSLHADPSLTCRNVLAVLEGVHDVRKILDTPPSKWEELRAEHPVDSQFRTALVQYYLQTHPCPSWGHIAGGCLYNEKDSALQAAKEWLKPDKGMGVCMAGHV